MNKQLELFPENEYVPFVSEVEIFNDTFGKPNNYTPVIPNDQKLLDFVVDFIYEETEELKEAIEQKDIVEVLDAIFDILYVAIGNATMVFGLKDRLLDAFNEVQASNMSKTCKTYTEALETIDFHLEQHGPCYTKQVGDVWIVYRERDDKVMKSSNYFSPNLEQFFTKEEIENVKNG
jgi:NTP pyrophosphatase (non-canonical NTP hydrolase)